MKKLTPFLMIALVSLAAVAPLYAEAPLQAAEQTQKSLYQRLGGYDALAAVSDDFLTRLAADQQMGRFFVGAEQRLARQASPACDRFPLCSHGRPVQVHRA